MPYVAFCGPYPFMLCKCETYTKCVKWGQPNNKHALLQCWPYTSTYISDEKEASACIWLCTVWQGQHRVDTMGFLFKTLYTVSGTHVDTCIITNGQLILVAWSTPSIFLNTASAVSRQLSAPFQEKSRLILLSHIVGNLDCVLYKKE